MQVEYKSCNGLGASPVDVAIGYLSSFFRSPKWFSFNGHKTIYTYQGRYAVHLICESLKIGRGDHVLVPAYNCGAEVDPFLWSGAQTILYRVDCNLKIDIEDIYRRVTDVTRLIYISHFFGWLQDISALVEWCKKRNIYVVEDYALSLFAEDSSGSAGPIGDAAIFSFVKSLPTPDGGALVVKKAFWKEWKLKKRSSIRMTLRNCLPLLKKWFMNHFHWWVNFETTRNLLAKNWMKNPSEQRLKDRPEMPKSNYFDETKRDWTLSRISMGILNHTRPGEVVERRRKNYQYLFEALNGCDKIRMPFDTLPKGVCPLAMPFFVCDREYWNRELSNMGILVGGWPSYHRMLDWDQYPDACQLKDRLITVPVHHQLDIRHMNYIANCVKKIAEKAGKVEKDNPS